MAPELTAAPAIEAHALARHVRVSPQKARLVLDLIRGQRAEQALQILHFTKKRIAQDVEKILRSAIANAERKAEDAGESLDVDHLFVSRCFANDGPRWKRLRPAPMGRRVAMFCERRAAVEAAASGADGAGVPLPEAHGAHIGGSGRARRGSGAARGSGGGGSGVAQGNSRSGEEGSRSSSGNTAATAQERR
jgi:large subunit ribosomal protein L22